MFDVTHIHVHLFRSGRLYTSDEKMTQLRDHSLKCFHSWLTECLKALYKTGVRAQIPGAGLISQHIDPQSSAIPLCYDCPHKYFDIYIVMLCTFNP